MLYLDTLKEGTTPFDRFVSRSDIKDMVDIDEPRRRIDQSIIKLLSMIQKDHTTRFFPITGAAGTGKTHLFWALKDREERLNCYIVYIPSPPAPVRMLFHIYSCLMYDLGDVILKKLGGTLVKQYGGSTQSLDPFGLFKVKRSTHEIQRLARKDFSGLQSEFVRTLITHYMRTTNWKLAERWLLGEALTEAELDKLSLSRVIEEDDISIAALKVITKYIDRPVIFYFDELEIPYNSYGVEAEIRLLSIQKRMYNEISNSLIIVACLNDIWPRVIQIIDSAMKSRMEMELELQLFTVKDTRNLFMRAMESFWDENNLPSPADKYFPLNEQVFDLVFQKTKGNPRDSIKMLKVFIDQILYDEELADHFKEQIAYIAKARAESSAQIPPTDKISPPSELNQEAEESVVPIPHEMGEKILSDLDELIESAVKKKEEEFEAELAEQIEVSPASIVSGAIDSILTFSKERGANIKVEFNFEFTVEGKNKSISSLLYNLEGRKIGIDVPTIKTFDKSGGVSAYYAIIRLKQALSEGIVEYACLIVPRETGGKKYTLVCEELGSKLTVIEMNDEEAKALIRNAKSNPSLKGREFARLIFKDLPLESPSLENEDGAN